jgi:hypothetical protein
MDDVRRCWKALRPYLWRVRCLRDGTLVVLASLYGTPWGPGRERATRNTMLPGETYQSKIQPFFLTSRDGREFSAPNYILPGIGAMNLILWNCRRTASLHRGRRAGHSGGRQFVTPSPDGWLNGTLYPICTGAPGDPVRDPRGGMCPRPLHGTHSGAASWVTGATNAFHSPTITVKIWTRIEPDVPFDFLYQPYLLALDGGRLGLYGHVGGDNAFGENDMTIQAQVVLHRSAPAICRAPRSSRWSGCLRRRERIYQFVPRTPDGGRPPAGRQEVEFRFNTYWNEDGSVNTPRRRRMRRIKNRYARTRKAGLLLRQCATTASERHTPGLQCGRSVPWLAGCARLHRPDDDGPGADAEA